MVWDGFDRRRFPRLKRRCEIYVYPELCKDPIITYTENIGAGGVCVVLDRELARLSQCRVKMILDAGIPEIECKSRVAWVVKTRVPKQRKNQFDTGIEFLDLDPDLFEKVRAYVENRVEQEGRAA